MAKLYTHLHRMLKVVNLDIFCYFEQACQLNAETITYEEKEQQLVNDCVKELSMFLFFVFKASNVLAS